MDDDHRRTGPLANGEREQKQRERRRAWRKANLEKARSADQRWRDRNRENYRFLKRRWYHKNRAKILAYKATLRRKKQEERAAANFLRTMSAISNIMNKIDSVSAELSSKAATGQTKRA